MYYAKTLSKTHAKAGQRNAEIKDHFVDDSATDSLIYSVKLAIDITLHYITIQNDLLHNSLIRQLYHFATDFNRVLLQLVGTDIQNSLFKYRVSEL